MILILNQNICCGYSKEPSQQDSYFEQPKHTFKLAGKTINKILHYFFSYYHYHCISGATAIMVDHFSQKSGAFIYFVSTSDLENDQLTFTSQVDNPFVPLAMTSGL